MNVTESTYYAWTAPRDSSTARRPSLDQLHQCCEVFNVSPTWIMFGIGPEHLDEVEDTHGEFMRLRESVGYILEAIDRNYDQQHEIFNTAMQVMSVLQSDHTKARAKAYAIEKNVEALITMDQVKLDLIYATIMELESKYLIPHKQKEEAMD